MDSEIRQQEWRQKAVNERQGRLEERVPKGKGRNEQTQATKVDKLRWNGKSRTDWPVGKKGAKKLWLWKKEKHAPN